MCCSLRRSTSGDLIPHSSLTIGILIELNHYLPTHVIIMLNKVINFVILNVVEYNAYKGLFAQKYNIIRSWILFTCNN